MLFLLSLYFISGKILIHVLRSFAHITVYFSSWRLFGFRNGLFWYDWQLTLIRKPHIAQLLQEDRGRACVLYLIVYCNVHEKMSSPAGNWTPVSRVTGGDTNHYTTEELLDKVAKQRLHSASGQVNATSIFSRLAERSYNWRKKVTICLSFWIISHLIFNNIAGFWHQILNLWINSRLIAAPMISQFDFFRSR